jgi:hypothetical protein
LNPTLENYSQEIAKRLTKRFKVQVFLAFSDQGENLNYVEKKLVEFLKEILANNS